MTQEPTTQERIEALHPDLQKFVADFSYEHLPREDLKETSKIFHDAMLALCENMQGDAFLNKNRLSAMVSITNKIWEGKNLAVHLKAKENK